MYSGCLSDSDFAILLILGEMLRQSGPGRLLSVPFGFVRMRDPSASNSSTAALTASSVELYAA